MGSTHMKCTHAAPTYVAISGGTVTRGILEEGSHNGPVEVTQQSETRRVEVAVARHDAEEVGVLVSVRQHGVCVAVGQLWRQNGLVWSKKQTKTRMCTT